MSVVASSHLFGHQPSTAGASGARSAPLPRETQAPPPPSRAIVVVEDDDAVRALLSRLLRAEGYAVFEAANASEAQGAVRAANPALVISDIVMPGRSGIDLRRDLAVAFPSLPVILVSGYSAERAAEFAARTPRTRFLPKPFNIQQVLDLVAHLLSRPSTSVGNRS